jgi:hypothetical protein
LLQNPAVYGLRVVQLYHYSALGEAAGPAPIFSTTAGIIESGPGQGSFPTRPSRACAFCVGMDWEVGTTRCELHLSLFFPFLSAVLTSTLCFFSLRNDEQFLLSQATFPASF